MLERIFAGLVDDFLADLIRAALELLKQAQPEALMAAPSKQAKAI